MDFLIIKNFICDQKILLDDPPVKKIDFLTNSLYPNISYWIDVGRSIDVALVQVQTMADEIKRRRPFFFFFKPKVKV